jgi:hypothetical protein
LLITSMGDWLVDMFAPVNDLFRTLTSHHVFAGRSTAPGLLTDLPQ